MTERNNGGSAFPHGGFVNFKTSEVIMSATQGMSLRDYFAAKASDEDIKEILYRKENTTNDENGYIVLLITRQQARFIHADAMLAEREK